MDKKTLDSQIRKLQRLRAELCGEVATTDAALQEMGEERESELEERAQRERMGRVLARLDDRGKRELDEIDAAVRRIREGTYGVCASCGASIPASRLRALPAAALCVDCARERERAPRASGEMEPERRPALPPDLATLSDSEIEQELRERLRQHPGIDMEELRLVCRHGVTYLRGTIPSEAEHRVLIRLLADVIGLREIVDHLRVREQGLWERRPPEPPRANAISDYEPASTSDLLRSDEEGIQYEPPEEPGPEEE